MGEGLEHQTDQGPGASHPKDPWEWDRDGLKKGTGLVLAASVAPKIFNAWASHELTSVLNSPDTGIMLLGGGQFSVKLA